MKHAMTILTLSALLGAAAPPAWASDIHASLDWSQFLVTLTDLDASDGVTPSLTWSNQNTGVNVLVIPPGGVVSQGPADWTSAISATQGPASATANGSGLAVDLTGMTTSISYAEGSASRGGDFSLSANTQAHFSLPAQVTVASVAGLDLSSGADIWVSYGSNFFSDGLNLMNGGASADTLQLNIVNGTTSPLDAHFNASVGFMAQPAAVPEPETWAMLVAGLGLTGFVARRHARRKERTCACAA